MIVKLPDEDKDFVNKLKAATGKRTAADAYRHAAELFLSSSTDKESTTKQAADTEEAAPIVTQDAAPIAEDENPSAAMETEKPPTIVVGVQGMDFFASDMSKQAPIEAWRKLVLLPPFQMYVTEKMPNPDGLDTDRLAEAFIVNHGFDEKLLNDYCDWHKAKGYWKNETPYGESIG